MKVKEFIEHLQGYPDNMEVTFKVDTDDYEVVEDVDIRIVKAVKRSLCRFSWNDEDLKRVDILVIG